MSDGGGHRRRGGGKGRGRPPGGSRQAVSHLEGSCRREGDSALAARLEAALRPGPGLDARALTHGFHPWPARLHPHTVATVLAYEGLPDSGAVLDPFMGGGTTLVEAMAHGRSAAGSDLNPVAREVAWARTRRWSEARIDGWVQGARALVERARALRKTDSGHARVPRAWHEAERGWWDPPALVAMWSLVTASLATVDEAAPGAARDSASAWARMWRVALSSLAVKASKQASDSVPKVDRDHRWVPANRVDQWFIARVEEHGEALRAFSSAVGPDLRAPRLATGDAAEAPRSLSLAEGDVGAIVTSPPYPGVYDYVAHHGRRYRLLGLDPEGAWRGEMGSRRQLRDRGWQSVAWTWADRMAEQLAAWRAVLCAGAPVVLVVGDGDREEGDGVLRVLPLVERAASKSGLVLRASASQQRRRWTPKGGPGRPERARNRAPKEEHAVWLEVAR